MDNLSAEEIKTIKDKVSSINETLKEQTEDIEEQNTTIGLIETRLKNMEIALNVNGSDVDILGNLSVAGNLLADKITVNDIEALGTVKTKEIKTEVLGITSEKISGKSEIKAGEREKTIITNEVDNNSKIYITIEGSNYGKVLYYDEIKEKENFKIKFDGDAVSNDIKFNWLIIK